MGQKFELYQDCGVSEYWMVFPCYNAVIVYVLNESERYIGLQPATSKLTSTIFPDLKINLEEIFS
ncbi:Uma2 family endonuclease [Dyadobacter crusticola]|uniref:Uma2 family endonuclease n=1 Tax=Dyadobacter crusticola TaxID=292407 RepID=UPI00068D99C9|nr:Uma2 family endonuclease [Dyadobacter crusticola]